MVCRSVVVRRSSVEVKVPRYKLLHNGDEHESATKVLHTFYKSSITIL